MKKLILIIFLFLIITPVMAKTNEGLLYEEYWQTSKVGVFAESSTGTMDYNGWMVKSTTDNNIYYCIEPESYMVSKEEAEYNSHTIYEGTNNIINNSRLTKDTYKKVSLLAYYGYKYKGHEDKKWYGITQTLIWRELRNDISWSFKESRYGSVNNNLYKNEVNELKTLVNNHYQTTSFTNKEITIVENDTITIKDTNNVLENFTITQDNDNIEITKNNNELLIKGLKEGTTKITMTKKSNITNNITLFSGKTLQDMLTRGKVDDVEATFTINIIKGELLLTKVDKETNNKIPQGDATLVGATYGIYQEQKLIKEIIFDETLEYKLNLPAGTYKIKELKAPLGYKLDEEIYEITINSNNKKIELILQDYVIKAELEIIKEKGGSGEQFTKESNAEFLITNNKNINEIIKTNEEGIAKITLPYGKYQITQIKGEDGYEFIEPYEIELKDEAKITNTLQNLRKSKVKFIKKDIDTKEYLPNTKISIYKEDNTLYFEGITNEKGIIEIENMPTGKYYIKELIAPPGYIINYEKQEFEILKNGEVIEIIMTNKKFEMPNTDVEEIPEIIKQIDNGIYNILKSIYNSKVKKVENNAKKEKTKKNH